MVKAWDVVGGKYRLRKQIGQGATGSVWEATHLQTNEPFALKLIEKPTKEVRQRLLRETRACTRLSHPNIVKLVDVGETETGDPFLVLELLQGQTLEALLKSRRRLDAHRAARIVCDIALAVETAHEIGIIHRDLKPANIFLHEAGIANAEPVVKILDFGISKSFESEDVAATATGLVVGSPAYMSPEQIGMREDLDPRSDIWSLGVVLYELLSGARPFSGALEDVIKQVLSAPIVPISDRFRDVPEELNTIVMRCLERNREQRIGSAKILAMLLEPFTVARPSIRQQPSPPSNAERAARSSSALEKHAPDTTVAPSSQDNSHTSGSLFVQPQGVTTTSNAASEIPIVIKTGTAARYKERARRTLLLAAGLGVAAVAALVALVVTGLSAEELHPEAAPASSADSATSISSSSAEIPNAPPPQESTTQAPVRTQAPTPAPPPSTSSTSTAQPQTNALPTAKPAPSSVPLPPCTPTFRKGCRNVSQPAKPTSTPYAPTRL